MHHTTCNILERCDLTVLGAMLTVANKCSKYVHQKRYLCAGTRSQSTECVPYMFAYTAADGRDVTVHIVDSPGLSDTEGIVFGKLFVLIAAIVSFAAFL